MSEPVLKAPFAWPGGKSRVADEVWRRFGNVGNYVEPFMGSLAVLLRRPADHFRTGYRVETANDADHHIVNFFRAVRADPEAVAYWADNPVTEADLHARHRWLVRSEFAADWRARMRTDPDAFDAKVAGWWVWGLCCWIGSGWCADSGAAPLHVPHLDAAGRGQPAPGGGSQQVPLMSHPGGKGGDALAPGDRKKVGERRPLNVKANGAGPGVHSGPYLLPPDLAQGRPQLADAFDIGRGVNSGASLQRPDLAGGNSADSGGVTALPATSTCDARRAWLTAWMRRLADRLRLVRTCYGHWSRVCDSESTMTRLGVTGVFLDPPYPLKTDKGTRAAGLYANDAQDLDALRDEVLAWCRKWGPNPQVRIAVCGYDGDGYEALVAEGWTEFAWAASGGYGNQRKDKKGKAENADRERIWFSPACLKPDAGRGLFDDIGEDS